MGSGIFSALSLFSRRRFYGMILLLLILPILMIRMDPMNEKEVSEIRRRFRADKSNISHVRGCYVNEKREIISRFDQSLALMEQTETEEVLSVLRKTLSGGMNKNLTNIVFETAQVTGSPEHTLLMKLRDSQLKDDEAMEALFEKVIAAITIEGNYLILLSCDNYDVPYRAKDDVFQHDASEEVYSYILCSICPVKLSKNALSFDGREGAFRNLSANWLVSAPEAGFLFPAFDDRSTNLYGALYYTRDAAENHPELAEALFHRSILMPPAAQKETFQSLLSDTLEEECDLDLVQTVRSRLCEMIAFHKESKIPEPLVVSKSAVTRILDTCGVPDDLTRDCEERYDEAFGTDTGLSPRNIVDVKQLEVKTPDVTIRVNGERSDLVETRRIDGKQYILIRVEDGVEVDGVNIHLAEE